jgi:hypothetical protein
MLPCLLSCPQAILLIGARGKFKIPDLAGRQWLTPVILTTREAEIRRILVRSQPQQKV